MRPEHQEEKIQGVVAKVVPEPSRSVSSAITNPMLSKLVSNDTEEGNKLPLLSSNAHSSSVESSEVESSVGTISKLSGVTESFALEHPTNNAYLTTFLLLNTMIGSGILNQPYVFYQSGIVGGFLGFICASIGTWLGLLCLTAAGVHVNTLEYSGLAKRAFQEHGERLVDVAIIILTFGAQLGYILVVGTTISQLLSAWGCSSVVCDYFFTTIVAVALFVMPVCMFRHFGHLAYISLFSIGAIVAVLMLVLIGGPIKHTLNHTSDVYNAFSITGTLKSVGSIVFSLSCASANFQAFISTEHKSRNLDSWKYITGSAVLAGTLMCMVMGLVGYLSFGSDTQGMILDNFPNPGYDFFRIMVVTHLILYIPVNFVIMRYSLVRMFANMKSENLNFFTHTVLTAVMLVGITALVLLLLGLGLASGDAFSLILNITGGVGGSLATLILPAAIYLKVMETDSPLYKPAIGLLVFGIFIMVAVVVNTILDYA
eukprot:gene28613-37589_t